jgi:hypothetical protein
VTSYKPELRVQPPRCTEARNRNSEHDRDDCPACRAWDHYMQTKRRDEIRSGVYVSNRYEAPVMRASRCKDHSRNTPGCKGCNAWARYQAALRRQAIAAGTFQASVPAAVARDHVKSLLDPETGGWYVHEIVAVSGMSIKTVQDIAAGARTGRVYADTWNALKVLQPKGTPRARTSDMVDGTEVRRTFQGLAAQGFTFEYLAGLMGKTSKNAANRCASDPSRWVTPESVEIARDLRRKLAGFDIAVLPEPMPGMHTKCATLAARKGWLPLSAWTDKTIANPAARPYIFAAPDDELGEGIAFIDGMLRHRVAAVAEKISEVDATRPTDQRRAYIDPIGRVTRLEAHAVVWLGTELGMTHAEIAKLLGYPSRSDQETKRGMRQVLRMHTNAQAARDWIDSDPRGHEAPAWLKASATCKEIRLFLPALFAVQPGPFGPGWSLAELSARCRTSEETMREFVAVATRKADRMWSTQEAKAARGRRPARCASRKELAHAA